MPRPRAVDGRAAVDKGLRDMFRALQSRPISDSLMSIVDQLDGVEAERRRARG